jgi:hypothetical protein
LHPKGASVVSNFYMKAGADEESKVGGMRMLILNLSYGSMTLPALATSGNPLRPMTVS